MPQLTPKRREALAAFFFILPTLVGFVIFIAYPLVESLRISFYEYGIWGDTIYIGTENYERLATDMRLRQTYRNTFVFTMFAVFFNAGLGLLLAVFLNRRMPVIVSNFYRSVFFFPILVAHTYISVIWKYLYAEDTGVFNFYLGQLDIAAVPWLREPGWAMAAIIIMDVWKNAGFAMLVFLAGLQSIPNEYYEAAQLDGANERQLFFRITIPLLSPTIFFILVIFFIGAFQVFDSIFVLTGGGPGDATRSVVMYIYQQAFQRLDFGYAAAVSWTLFLVIMAVTLVQFWGSRRWVHYE